MKYMVMECHPGYAVVLSEDGQFLKVANLHYEVGQTVTDVIRMVAAQPKAAPAKQTARRWISLAAAAAACLVLTVTGLVWRNMPYASVYMTINPEVRIDVNRSDSVVGLEGINADGMDLLADYEYKHKGLDQVMDELVDRAIDMGYLHEGGTILLNLDADDKWVANHEEAINSRIHDHLGNKLTVTVDITPAAQGLPAQETHGGETIVIPLDGESDYGISDYGEDDWEDDGDSGYASDDREDDDGKSNYDDGSSRYDSDDDGASPYEKDAGASDYESDTDDDAEDGSPYDSKNGSSGYESDDDDDDEKDDEDSPYSDDGQTDYDEPAPAAKTEKAAPAVTEAPKEEPEPAATEAQMEENT